LDTVKKWLDSLPSLDGSPWLLYWYGECLMVANPRDSWPYFEQALNLFRAQRDVTGVFLSWMRVVLSIRLEPTADARQLDRWITLFDELLRDHPQFPSREIEVGCTACLLLSFMMRQPENPKMQVWEARAVSLLHSGLPPLARVELGTFLQIHHCMRGDHPQAKLEFNLVRASAAEAQVPVLLQLYRHTAEAFYGWTRSEFDENLRRTCWARAGAQHRRTRI
jgi:hypothetical protein